MENKLWKGLKSAFMGTKKADTNIGKSSTLMKTFNLKNSDRPGSTSFIGDQRDQLGNTNGVAINKQDLYSLSKYSDIVFQTHDKIKGEIFRPGFDVNQLDDIEDEFQKSEIDKLITKTNTNNQNLKELLGEFEDDLNIGDDAFILCVKDYIITVGNEILGGGVNEFITLNPLSVKLMVDKAKRLGYDASGQRIYFNPANRGETTYNKYNKDGIKNIKACYQVLDGQNNTYSYYGSNEIIHASKYKPSKTYGFSPLYSLYNKAMTLILMDSYIKQYYGGGAPPGGLLSINTSNGESFTTFWENMLTQIGANPNAIVPMINETDNGKSNVEWIDFRRNLVEMDYTAVRDEIRRGISAMYGVSPVFQNDQSAGGGLNNEGLQVAVTDRAVERGQSIYNDKILPWMLKQIGITGYELVIASGKEIDAVYEKELMLKDIEIATNMKALGMEVKYLDDGSFSYAQGVVEIQPEITESVDSTDDNLSIDTLVSTPDPTKADRKVQSVLLGKKLVKKVASIGKAVAKQNKVTYDAEVLTEAFDLAKNSQPKNEEEFDKISKDIEDIINSKF